MVAPIINGFLAWVVGYYPGSFETWKIIFLLVGALTIVTSVVVYFVLYATILSKLMSSGTDGTLQAKQPT